MHRSIVIIVLLVAAVVSGARRKEFTEMMNVGASDKCFCKVILGGGYDQYLKSNTQIRGPGGQCCGLETSCKDCSRLGEPCCEMNEDNSMGECGKIKQGSPDWASPEGKQKCQCDTDQGLRIVSKADLWNGMSSSGANFEANCACQPSSKCEDCHKGCKLIKEKACCESSCAAIGSIVKKMKCEKECKMKC